MVHFGCCSGCIHPSILTGLSRAVNLNLEVWARSAAAVAAAAARVTPSLRLLPSFSRPSFSTAAFLSFSTSSSPLPSTSFTHLRHDRGGKRSYTLPIAHLLYYTAEPTSGRFLCYINYATHYIDSRPAAEGGPQRAHTSKASVWRDPTPKPSGLALHYLSWDKETSPRRSSTSISESTSHSYLSYTTYSPSPTPSSPTMSYNHQQSDSISNAMYPADSSYTPGGGAQNRQSTNSLANALYPVDSGYTPGGQNHHPSDSLANAAYPQDSAYRPAAPTSHPDDKLAMPQARYSQSYNTAAMTGPGAASRQAPTTAYPQYPPATQQPQAWTPTHDPYSPAVTPWSPDGMSAANPNLPPPPPYDPSRPGTGATGTSTPRDPISPNPSESALLGQQQQQQQAVGQQRGVPAQSHSIYTASPQVQQQQQQQQAPPPAAPHIADPDGQDGQPRAYLQSMTGGMPAYGNSPGGLGPVAKARKKKKQKLAILAAVLCAILLLLIGLIVGVLVGIVNRKDDKPPPPGQTGPRMM